MRIYLFFFAFFAALSPIFAQKGLSSDPNEMVTQVGDYMRQSKREDVEKIFKEFAINSKLPIIQENCPACFSAPKERHRMKVLLSQQENLFPSLFSSLQKAMLPLMRGEVENGDRKKDDIEI